MLMTKGLGYDNVDRIAEEQGLTWDGQIGSPYGLGALVDASVDVNGVEKRYPSTLFDHTIRFKQPGSGRRRTVLAIVSPYYVPSSEMHTAVNEIARDLGLFVRVAWEAVRVYYGDNPERVASLTTPVLIWRSDLHTLK